MVFKGTLLIDFRDGRTVEINEGEILIGKPYLDKVKIKGKVLEHLRGRKTLVYKMRPKKKTRKKQGHRQELTRVLIEEININ